MPYRSFVEKLRKDIEEKTGMQTWVRAWENDGEHYECLVIAKKKIRVTLNLMRYYEMAFAVGYIEMFSRIEKELKKGA